MMRDERSSAEPATRQRYRSDSRSVGEARQDLADWLAAIGADADLVSRATLVLSELATNAVEASADPFDATWSTTPHGIELSVTNRAPDQHLPDRHDWGPDHALAVRGRGLAIVETLSETVRVDDDGATVRVVASLRPRA